MAHIIHRAVIDALASIQEERQVEDEDLEIDKDEEDELLSEEEEEDDLFSWAGDITVVEGITEMAPVKGVVKKVFPSVVQRHKHMN